MYSTEPENDIIDAEIVEEAAPAAESEMISPKRTLTFFTDPRTSTFLLGETIAALLASLKIEHALVDLTNMSGVVIAKELVKAGIPYDLLDFGQQGAGAQFEKKPDGSSPEVDVDYDPHFDPGEDTTYDLVNLRHKALGTIAVNVAELGTINTNIVLVPALVHPYEKHLDLSPQTIPGAVYTQMEERQRALIMIGTPEQGLTPVPPEEAKYAANDPEAANELALIKYHRGVMHVGARVDGSAPEEPTE